MKKRQIITINGKNKIYVGIDKMKYQGVNMIILADDINNRNTYGRYTQNYITGNKKG